MITNKVQFIYENKLVELENPDPNQTILSFIRDRLKKTGTKEGCAEGGCGACTIVLGELENKKIKYKAINSCISFTPTLHGKQLIVVENLVSQDGSYHPVQEAMAKYHASQCGFCTPGFVMSIFAMSKNKKNNNNDDIKDAISGNLCRCTGYRPIIDAAKNIKKKYSDEFYKNSKKTINLLKKIHSKSIIIENKNKKYFAPKTINELRTVIQKNPDSDFLSGGTDLSLKVTKDRQEIKKIINLNNIKELNFIKTKNNEIIFGSTTPLIQVEKFILKYYPDFNNILRRYGSVQIRNVGTIGGNIATASPIGDTLPLLLSLNAKIIIQAKKGSKQILLNNFFIKYRKTKLKKGEFIKSIIIPIYKNHNFKAYKISKRFDDDISSVCASFNFKIKDQRIQDAAIAYGGMAEIPKRAKNCENFLKNSKFSEDIFEKAKDLLKRDFNPISDMRASKQYRLEVAENLLIKFFIETKTKKLFRVYQ
ncbi:xanthine dehydrogenase small subunit [Candidatus Pelagibacter sp.]|nr:xanthine dehydrogenase small subunit [Candidatus Pelagibacter sp.]